MPSEPSDSSGRRSGLRQLAVLRRLLGLVVPHKRRFAAATAALLAGSGLALIYPQAARYAVDMGISGGSVAELNEIVAALMAIFLLHGGLVWVRHYLMSWLGERVVADLRVLVFDKLLTMPSAWFHQRRTGELTGRLASDVTVIEGVVGSDLSIALRNVVQLVGGMILLVIENAYLTGLMLLVIPPLSIGVVTFGRAIRKMSRAVQDRLAETSAQIQESLGGIETVQAFVREEREAEIYAGGVESAFRQALSLARWRAWFFSTTSVAGYAAVVFIIWMGGREVIAERLSPGDLAAFMLYTLIVATALANVASLWGSLQRASGATERLFSIVDTLPEIRDPDEPLPMPAGRGRVRFDDVSFRYPSRPEQLVLDDVCFEIEPGQAVAVVGPSGAGKTTLTALLFRFFDVTRGSVSIDGADVRTVALDELRRSMAMVAQEPILFSGTIRDNISYGKPDATFDEIREAAERANAHGFIEGFAEGYDTPCGERGVKLSGGQKQRIAIARAILADPRLLILDEATSNLDSESEAAVQAALAELMHQRTTLVIAHRLSTVRDADRIVVLDGGRVVEQGKHAELVAGGGLYARLVEHQLS